MSGRWPNATLPSSGIPKGRQNYQVNSYVNALNTASRAIVWLVEVDAARYSQLYTTVGPLAPNATVPNASLIKGVRPTISTVKLRWASRSFVTTPTDSPAKTFIDGRLVPPAILKELGAVDDGAWGGIVRIDVGEIELSNSDGELDTIGASYTFEGRPVRILAGAAMPDARGADQLPSMRSMAVVYSGEIERWSYSRNSVRLIVKSRPAGFDKLVKGSDYPGHGGSAGSAELAGVARPLCFGHCLNVTPVLADQANLIYQVHDGELREVIRVKDGGAALRFSKDVATYDQLAALRPYDPDAAWDLDIDAYATCLNEGFIRLGSFPFSQVTVDVLGAGGRGAGSTGLWENARKWEGGRTWEVIGNRTYRDKAAGVAGDLLETYAGVEINRASFSRIDDVYGRRISLFIGSNDTITVADAVDRLMRTIPAVLVQDVSGKWWPRVLAPPAAQPLAVLTDLEILRSDDGPDIERPDLPYGRPWPSWRIAYRRNWTQMSEQDIVDVVTGDARVFLTQQSREVSTSDGVLAMLYSDRQGASFESLLIDVNDAYDLSRGFFNLYNKDRRMFRVRAKGHLFLYNIGDTIAINHRRHGLSGTDTIDTGDGELDIDAMDEDLLIGIGAQRFVIVGIREDGVARTTEFTLWG